MPRMHADELDVDDALVQVLVAEQFPEWAGLPVERIEPGGTVHLIFRLGDELSIRLPRRLGPTVAEDDEHTWLPRLAPQTSVKRKRSATESAIFWLSNAARTVTTSAW